VAVTETAEPEEKGFEPEALEEQGVAVEPEHEPEAEHVVEAEAEPPEEEVVELESAGGTGDAEGARLIALNMALNGTPREETDRYLAENFELPDRDGLLDEVYASVEG
jgi:hypothetical protein